MADKSILWRGKKYLLPQASSFIDSSALGRAPLGGGCAIVLLGNMNGLCEPKKAHKVGSAVTALSLLHPGSEEARLAARLLFGPSPGSDTPGASEVYLIPVNAATLATKTASAVLKLDSYLYGLPANQVKYKISTGTTGKKIEIGYGEETEVFDNLLKNSFSILYTGAGSAAAMTILPTAAGHSLSTTCTGAAGDNLSLDLLAYDSIQALADAITATGVYTVTILTDSPSELTMQLDTATAVDIKTGAYTATSSLQAIVDGLKASGYVNPSRVADAGTVPANTTGWVYLAGGTNGTMSTTDWETALLAAQSVDAQLIVSLSADAAVHALVDTHCAYMSGPAGKIERRGIVGGALQTWVSEANRTAAITAIKDAIKLINSDRMVHMGLGCYQYDPNGRAKLYPAYITAAMFAGIAAGSYPVEPVTRKYYKCLGLEADLRPEEIDSLIQAGCAAPIADTVNGAGFVCSRQVTTWLKDLDLYRMEFSVGQGADYIARQVRSRHALLVGKAGAEGLDATIINVTNGVLADAKRAGYIRDFDPKQTAIRVDGTIRYVDYAAEPILPVNFIFSTYYLTPTLTTITL